MGLRCRKDSLRKYHEEKSENEKLRNKVVELEQRDTEKDFAITELELNDIEKDLAITDLELAVLDLQTVQKAREVQETEQTQKEMQEKADKETE